MTRTKTKDLTLTAMMAAVICVLAPISIPIPVSSMPLSLGTFALYLTAYVLKPKMAFAATALYLLMGAVGLPVFAGYSAGFSRFAGAGGGYLTGYLFLVPGGPRATPLRNEGKLGRYPPFPPKPCGANYRYVSGNIPILRLRYILDVCRNRRQLYRHAPRGRARVPSAGQRQNPRHLLDRAEIADISGKRGVIPNAAVFLP